MADALKAMREAALKQRRSGKSSKFSPRSAGAGFRRRLDRILR